MLPAMMLQVTDLVNFEGPVSGGNPLSEGQTAPVAGFAALLDIDLEAARTLVLDGGQSLPADGNPLPSEYDVEAIVMAMPPEGQTDNVVNPLLQVPAQPASVSIRAPVPAAVRAMTLATKQGQPQNVGITVAGGGPADPAPAALAEATAFSADGRPALPEQFRAATTPNLSGDGSVPAPPGARATSAGAGIGAGVEPLPGIPSVSAAPDAARPSPAAAAAMELPAETRKAETVSQQPPGMQREPDRLLHPGGQAPPLPAAASISNAVPAVDGAEPPTPQFAPAAVSQSVAAAQRLPVEIGPGQTQAGPAIEIPVTDAEWGDQLSQRIQFMTSHKLQTAELRLTPAELGPLRVQVAVDDGAATVTFHAQHAVTREAIEQALPRLREMLAENGLTLAQSSVGDQGVSNGGREADAEASAPGLESGDVAADGELTGAQPVQQRRADGLVDTFA